MKALWIEMKRFIVDYLLFMIIGTIIIGVFYAGVTTLLDRGDPNLEEVEMGSEPGEEVPAYFQFFVEQPDGQPYSNTGIIEQYIRLRSVLEDASAVTNTEVYEVVRRERAAATPQAEWSVALTRNEHTRLHTLTINIGEESDNLAVAEYYFDMIVNDEIPFLANKDVHIFIEPELIETDDGLLTEDGEESSSFSVRTIVVNIIFGFVLGVVVMAGIALLRSLFSKKLRYSFSYTWKEGDLFFLSDKQLNNEDELKQLFTLPLAKGKVLLSENKINETTKLELVDGNDLTFDSDTSAATTVIEKQSIADLDAQKEIPEILIAVQANETSRAWYRKQRRLLEAYEVPVKVIQFN